MKISIKPVYYWVGIFALCSLAYQWVQDTIRPTYQGTNPTVQYLLGIAPNFFPSIGIPALLVTIIPMFGNKSKPNPWLSTHKHLTAIAISLTGLLTWEFLQQATPKGRFDWHDVLWTFIGALVFQGIWTITSARYKEDLEA